MSKLNALRKGESCHSDWCEVRVSGIHGRGIFAKMDIPGGTPIIEYTGEKITKEESHRRGWAQIDHAKVTGDAAVYIFTLDDEYDIDGNFPENSARLINHSCESNCEAYIDGESIWIAALFDIAKDTELFYNYGFDLECYEEHPCYCGSEKCVGHIAGEEYWPALKRKISRKKSARKASALKS
jgi:SET domain-containing protein